MTPDCTHIYTLLLTLFLLLLVFLFADDCMGIPLTNLSVKKSIPEMNECLPSCRAESTHKGVKQRRLTSHKHNNKSESPTITLTWHACKYKVHKLHERYILFILFIFFIFFDQRYICSSCRSNRGDN